MKPDATRASASRSARRGADPSAACDPTPTAKPPLAPPRPIRVLTFSTLYPNAVRGAHGVFVENRIRHLAAQPEVEVRVVAPIARLGRYTARSAPRRETRHGLEVLHPRYLHIPGIGAARAPKAIAQAALPHLARLRSEGFPFDIIDGHYLHPDGVAAALLARHFDVPLVLTARGSDVTQLPDFPQRRRTIEAALAQADAVVAVCRALVPDLQPLGVAAADVGVLTNGVDLRLFRPPGDRAALRCREGIDGPSLLSVGHLVERKGHHLVIDAVRHLPDFHLRIVGDGPERRFLCARIRDLGLRDRVRLLGAVPHADLPSIYGAADALVLASSREGWANVLLESMACGTPTIATAVGGSPEVIADPSAGELAAARSVPAILAAIVRLFARPIDRAAVRAHAERHPWDRTARGLVELFQRVLRERAAPTVGG